MKTFRRAVPVLGLLGIGLLVTPASAAPRSIKDCEKIQAADAYNRCLAMFGPVAHLHLSKTATSDGDDDAGGDGPAPGASRGHHSARHESGLATGHHHGQDYVILDMGSSEKSATAHARRHHSGHHRHGHRHWRHRHHRH